jgi:hypothetical protein
MLLLIYVALLLQQVLLTISHYSLLEHASFSYPGILNCILVLYICCPYKVIIRYFGLECEVLRGVSIKLRCVMYRRKSVL